MIALRRTLFLLALASPALRAADAPAPAVPSTTVVLVLGAAGEDTYRDDFLGQANAWEKAAKAGGAKLIAIGRHEEPGTVTDLEELKQALAAEPKDAAAPDLWLVLVGHGTFDGKSARFNLRGPDLSADELADWLKPFKRPLALIDTSSSSAPYLAKLAGPGRVVITATRSGFEQNYARFGRYLSESVADPASDLDKDGQTSLLEAFLSASAKVAEYYKSEGRLLTEHALLDDNGDGLGTPPEWFRGVRAVKKAADGKSIDGVRAQQFCLVRSAAEQRLSPEARAHRDQLERDLAVLRDARPKLKEADYYARLEKLLLELAHLYETPPDS